MMTTDKLPWYIDMYMHTGVPLWMLGCIFAVAVIAIMIRWRLWCQIVLGAYLMVILCHAVIFRESGGEMQVMLMPFRNYGEAFGKWNLELLGEIVMNVVLFVPVGLIGAMKFRWYHVLAIGAGFSVFIELLQLLLSRGLCETDDVIHNTLGTLIGCVVMKSVIGLVKVVRGMVTKTITKTKTGCAEEW